ncbi:mycofactocin-coupled SDR family oxidoreductase [Rhodococcus opacus]|uniref:mycofactocin-coupled SDR family oxidoreductase n=1 Tax=Rhodococcus opacus TaxID=37919 RepID=UPI001C437D68|nr:mycofactocin-coupled SDR family oxidoreductase [Rhodococcus opacus]MBV6760247.1 mycofactocin-coupled SDR family oxidoreductase [Rhodococcus opacus]
MTGRVQGKVAFITGIARGQGRAHALRLVEEGAAGIIGLDVCDAVEGVDIYPPSTLDDLQTTIKLVEELGGKIVAEQGDVRNSADIKRALDKGIETFGRLDIVCANAGILTVAAALEQDDVQWKSMMDINVTGVWNTCREAIPHLIDSGGGSIIITSSTAGTKGNANTLSYNVSKHGVVGMMRTLANEFGCHNIRVNTVHPTSADTPMVMNEKVFGLFDPSNPKPTRADAEVSFATTHVMPVAVIEPRDVSEAILWLGSDESRYVTGAVLPIDAGFVIR